MRGRLFITSGLLATVIFILLVVVVVLYSPYKPVKINAGTYYTTVSKAEVADLFRRKYLANGHSGAVLGESVPITVQKEESVKSAQFQFNAIAPSWDKQLFESSQVKIEIRSSLDAKDWSEWQEVQIDEDGDAHDRVESSKVYGGLIVTRGKYFQERFTFETRSLSEIPEIKNFTITYIDSKEKNNFLEKILKKIKLRVQKVVAANAPDKLGEAPSVCSRSCWGADESLMTWSPEYLTVQKMVVHHTATDNNDPDPKATIRAIYYFHAVTRGWGDIGYNFIIDQNGEIYQGREGDNGVIGAHARGYNTGSVGVGVLGDFRYVYPSKRVQNALHQVAVWKFVQNKVDSRQVSSFGDPPVSIPGVTFHGNLANTACAGTNLNQFVPNLIDLAQQMPQQIIYRDNSGVKRITGSADETVADLLDKYKALNPTPNYIRKISAFPSDGTTAPNDANYSSQWDLAKLDALRVWKETSGGSASVKVAVLDTGVAYEDYDPPGPEVYAKGPDFASTNFVPGYDFVNNDDHPNDDHGHGTAVASVIAESTNNSIGSASLAYNVSIMPIKVCSSAGFCADLDVAQGIDFARTNGAKVINMSLGGYFDSQTIQTAIDAAWNAGLVVVAAAGNDGQPTVSYPGRGNHVIAVGALDSSDNKAYYSNYGEALDLMAPGGDGSGGIGDLLYQELYCSAGLVCTTFNYSMIAGTSVAASLVSATAALLAGKGVVWPENVERFIKLQAADLGSVGWDEKFGWGRISSFNALLLATNDKPHPNGSLIKAKDDDKVYFIEAGQKRWIPGPGVLLSRFNPKIICETSAFEVSSYPSGNDVTFSDGSLLRGSSHPVYLISDGQKHWIKSPEVFLALGYKPDQINNVNDSIINAFPDGFDINTASSHLNGALFRASGETKVYLIDGGKKHWIPSPGVLISRFDPKMVLEVSVSEVNSYEAGSDVTFSDGTLLSDTSNGKIYVLSDGKKRWIGHPMTFFNLGYKPENINFVSSQFVSSLAEGQSVK